MDDHPVTRKGIIAMLSGDPSLEICGEADSAPAALAAMLKTVPDLALVDISLKAPNGIELTKNLHTMIPRMRVLIISMHDEELYAERCVRAGAHGYVMKAEAAEKIAVAVRKVLRGELYVSDKMKERILGGLMINGRSSASFSIHSLSDRELEVFCLIGTGYGTRDIAAKLNLSIKTIDSHREHMKIKLGLKRGADLIRYAIQWVTSCNAV
ncbi:response regulator transcription factor [Termitidicoccus mucosus]